MIFFWQYFVLTLAVLWGGVPSLWRGEWWWVLYYAAVCVFMSILTRRTWRTIDRCAALEASTAAINREIYAMTTVPEEN